MTLDRGVKNLCAARVSTPVSRIVGKRQCHRKGVVLRDGKLYCRQHDPIVIKAKEAARRQKDDVAMASAQRRWCVEAAAEELLAALELAVGNGPKWRKKAKAAIKKARGG